MPNAHVPETLRYDRAAQGVRDDGGSGICRSPEEYEGNGLRGTPDLLLVVISVPL